MPLEIDNIVYQRSFYYDPHEASYNLKSPIFLSVSAVKPHLFATSLKMYCFNLFLNAV